MANLKGNTIGVIWGTGSGLDLTDAAGSGIIVKAAKNKDGKLTEIPNGDGDTVVAVLHDDHTMLELELIVGTGTTVPDRGDDIEICGVTGTVLSARQLWERGSEAKLSVQAKKWELIS